MKRMSIALIAIISSMTLISCKPGQIIVPTITSIHKDTATSRITTTYTRIITPTFTSTYTITPSSTITPIPTLTPTFIGGGMGKFAFEDYSGTDTALGLINIDGSNKVMLMGDNIPANSPSWSSFYKRLYFYANPTHAVNNGFNIYSSNISGSDIQLVNIPSVIHPRYITVSPDGKKIIA
jgi:hypothetical protein